VLVRQLLAMTLQFGGVTAEADWDQLYRVPDFKGITREQFDRLLAHLTAKGYLFISSASSNAHYRTTSPSKWWTGIYWIYRQHKAGYEVNLTPYPKRDSG
jgi:hypothetical protein